MIDNCHALRMLLNSLKPKDTSVLAKFAGKYGGVTQMRNAMDHLHQQIGSLARKTGSITPLFGAFSFALIQENDIEPRPNGQAVVKGARLVTLAAGTPVGKGKWQVARDLSDGKPIEFPVGQFQFEAFDM
jgi:hypothetical protein